MKRIKFFFRHNLQWKLIALVSAFFVWLIAVNASNPKVNGNVTVSFDVLNEKALVSSSQIYTLSSDSVTVSYTVRQRFKNDITPEAFTAYINLEDYSVTGTVPVYLEVDSAVTDQIADIKVNPSVIHVYTESIQQKKFAVKPYVTGDTADGYIAGEPEVSPEYIYVKGPVSVMGQISGVGISIDINGISDDLEGTMPVSFLDANGNILTGIEDTLSFAGDITYSVPVYRIKPLSVNAFTGGAPASGYTVDSVETSPTFISVYGPEEILNEYSYILIPGSAINVSGINENKTYNIDSAPYIPQGLKTVGQTPEISVYVKVRSIYDTHVPETTSAALVTEETTVQATEPVTESAESAAEQSASPETAEPEMTGGDYSLDNFVHEETHAVYPEETTVQNTEGGSEETLPQSES